MTVGLTDWQKERAAEYIGKGWTLAEAAMILKCSKEEIMDALELQSVGAKEEETSAEYREGFANGYRMALTHIRLYGEEGAHEHWQYLLLPWRKRRKAYAPPAFLRIHGGS